MSKLAKKVLISILTLSFVLLSVPFSIHQVKAESIDDYIVGVNIESIYVGNNLRYKYDFIFNDYYYGSFNVTITHQNNPGSITTTLYFNDNHVEYISSFSTYYNVFTYNSYDFTQYIDTTIFENKNIPLESYSIYGYFLNSGASFDNDNSIYYLFNQSYPILTGYNIYNSYQSSHYISNFQKVPSIIVILIPDTNRHYLTMYNSTTVKDALAGNVLLNDSINIEYYKFTPVGNYFKSTIKMDPIPDKYIPLYTGPIDNCPSYILNILDINNSLDNTSDNVDNTNNEFNQTINDFDDLEQNLTSDFNDNLDDIDFNVNPGTHFGTNFINATSWVTQQFNSLITNNPFGDILTFSLTFGIALLLIGRIL